MYSLSVLICLFNVFFLQANVNVPEKVYTKIAAKKNSNLICVFDQKSSHEKDLIKLSDF